MSREARAEATARLPQEAVATTTLPSIAREYTFNEIAIMTRAAPAKLLGLKDRGHLGEGGLADIAVYSPSKDLAKMFRFAHLVFKDGDLVVRDGRVSHYRWGKALKEYAACRQSKGAALERGGADEKFERVIPCFPGKRVRSSRSLANLGTGRTYRSRL